MRSVVVRIHIGADGSSTHAVELSNGSMANAAEGVSRGLAASLSPISTDEDPAYMRAAAAEDPFEQCVFEEEHAEVAQYLEARSQPIDEQVSKTSYQLVDGQQSGEIAPPDDEHAVSEAAAAEPEQAPAPAKPKNKIGDFVFYAFLLLVVVGSFVLFGGAGNGPRMIAGYSAFTVTTGSMHDVLPQGSLIVTQQVDPETLQVGDDITYMTSETTSITHRIVDIVKEYEATGERAFKTKGTMNKAPDSKLVPAVNVVGKVVFCSSALGIAVGFVQDNWPLLIFLAVIAAGLTMALKRILRD